MYAKQHGNEDKNVCIVDTHFCFFKYTRTQVSWGRLKKKASGNYNELLTVTSTLTTDDFYFPFSLMIVSNFPLITIYYYYNLKKAINVIIVV